MSSSASQHGSDQSRDIPEAQPLGSLVPESGQEGGETTDDEHDVLGLKRARRDDANGTAAGGVAAAGTSRPVAGGRVSPVTKCKYMSLAEELYQAARHVATCTTEHDKTRAKLDEAKERLADVKRTFDETMHAVAFPID